MATSITLGQSGGGIFWIGYYINGVWQLIPNNSPVTLVDSNGNTATGYTGATVDGIAQSIIPAVAWEDFLFEGFENPPWDETWKDSYNEILITQDHSVVHTGSSSLRMLNSVHYPYNMSRSINAAGFNNTDFDLNFYFRHELIPPGYWPWILTLYISGIKFCVLKSGPSSPEYDGIYLAGSTVGLSGFTFDDDIIPFQRIGNMGADKVWHKANIKVVDGLLTISINHQTLGAWLCSGMPSVTEINWEHDTGYYKLWLDSFSLNRRASIDGTGWQPQALILNFEGSNLSSTLGIEEVNNTPVHNTGCFLTSATPAFGETSLRLPRISSGYNITWCNTSEVGVGITYNKPEFTISWRMRTNGLANWNSANGGSAFTLAIDSGGVTFRTDYHGIGIAFSLWWQDGSSSITPVLCIKGMLPDGSHDEIGYVFFSSSFLDTLLASDGEWNHFAVVLYGDLVRVYLNGDIALEYSVPPGFFIPTNQFFISNINTNNTDFDVDAVEVLRYAKWTTSFSVSDSQPTFTSTNGWTTLTPSFNPNAIAEIILPNGDTSSFFPNTTASFDIGNILSGDSLVGAYFIISSPTRSYYVWYVVDGVGTDPLVPGFFSEGIMVNVLSTDSATQVRDKTIEAIAGHVTNGIVVFAAMPSGDNSVYVYNFVGGELAYTVSSGTSGFTVVVSSPGSIMIEATTFLPQRTTIDTSIDTLLDIITSRPQMFSLISSLLSDLGMEGGSTGNAHLSAEIIDRMPDQLVEAEQFAGLIEYYPPDQLSWGEVFSAIIDVIPPIHIDAYGAFSAGILTLLDNVGSGSILTSAIQANVWIRGEWEGAVVIASTIDSLLDKSNEYIGLGAEIDVNVSVYLPIDLDIFDGLYIRDAQYPVIGLSLFESIVTYEVLNSIYGKLAEEYLDAVSDVATVAYVHHPIDDSFLIFDTSIPERYWILSALDDLAITDEPTPAFGFDILDYLLAVDAIDGTLVTEKIVSDDINVIDGFFSESYYILVADESLDINDDINVFALYDDLVVENIDYADDSSVFMSVDEILAEILSSVDSGAMTLSFFRDIDESLSCAESSAEIGDNLASSDLSFEENVILSYIYDDIADETLIAEDDAVVFLYYDEIISEILAVLAEELETRSALRDNDDQLMFDEIVEVSDLYTGTVHIDSATFSDIAYAIVVNNATIDEGVTIDSLSGMMFEYHEENDELLSTDDSNDMALAYSLMIAESLATAESSMAAGVYGMTANETMQFADLDTYIHGLVIIDDSLVLAEQIDPAVFVLPVGGGFVLGVGP